MRALHSLAIAAMGLWTWAAALEPTVVETSTSVIMNPSGTTPPVVVTGNPVAVSATGATLLGAVHPNGTAVRVRFVYGATTLYGATTDWQNIPAGSNLVDVLAPITGLIPGATYHYGLIATNDSGIWQGADVSFLAAPGSGGSGNGIPTAMPIVTTGGVASVETNGAELLGTVNPMNGTTTAHFQYGTTSAYGQTSAIQGVGGGTTTVAVSLSAMGLLPGTTYHYRLSASNSLGSAHGQDQTFTTTSAAPTVATGGAHILTSTSATVAATVSARGLPAQAFIDFGTSPTTLTHSISTVPSTVTGDAPTAVSAVLTDLTQGTTYYYQVRAVNAGGTSRGNILTFDAGVLYGLSFSFPPAIAPEARQGTLTLNLTPANIGSAWRIKGETAWRPSGSAATGLCQGKWAIEYRPVPGYLPPPDESVVLDGSNIPVVLTRIYPGSGVTGNGSLTATLQPSPLAGAFWRLFGESAAQWKTSGTTMTGLIPGDYEIECSAAAGRSTPAPVIASVADGQTTLVTITYDLSITPPGPPPESLTFDAVSGRQDRPYAYVGQITSDAGSGTGFVVRPRVVATAGHVVFDDITLAATTGVRWHFQRHLGVHEPVPQFSRGYALLTGYADQRRADHSPGISTPESQNLDAAALYFLDDAGRGGFSGYLASDSSPNEFLLSHAMKSLAGYPVEPFDPSHAVDPGTMYATAPADITFTRALDPGQTYSTQDIRSSGGNSGGPLCVQHSSGTWYPAAIYLGGGTQSVVRAIDSSVVALFESAELLIYPVPVFTLQPVSTKAVPSGTQTTLTSLATISMTSNTTLLYQWYEGASGDVSRPVPGATSPHFTTPPITQTTAFWVRATSMGSGTSADSTTATLTVTTSANAKLANLSTSQGVLSPAFNADITDYTVDVPYATSISIKPTSQVALSTIVVNDTINVVSGTASPPIPLTGSTTIIPVTVTAGDGLTTQHYTITVTRSLPPAMVITGDATDVTSDAATLHGSVIPNGSVSAYFQYLIPGDSTYKNTPVQILQGNNTPIFVSATVTGLPTSGLYQFRLVVLSGTVMFTGGDKSFAIIQLPLVATGTPIVTGTIGNDPPYKVTLVGAVNPVGRPIQVHFEIGPTPSFGSSTITRNISAGSSTVNVLEPDAFATITPAINPVVNATYYYRIVANGFAGGPIFGATVSFQWTPNPGGAAPTAATANASDITTSSATLNGLVNPNGKSTFSYFEYGLDATYGNSTTSSHIGEGNSVMNVTHGASGLLPGTLYHFRCVAANGNGKSTGQDATFTTTALPPIATTGTAEALTSSSVKVRGTVLARGAPTTVGVEYATHDDFSDGITVIQATPVTGDVTTPVSIELTGLSGTTTYYFRLKANNSGGTSYGVTRTFQANSLMGFKQGYTATVAPNDYQGQVQVVLDPSGGGWRFVGETQWRASGTTAMGLTTGDRQIEYQPLDGRIQPPNETVGVVSGDPALVLNRYYYESAVVGDLQVHLQPPAAVSNGARWRIKDAPDTGWRKSGEPITGLWPGNYEIEYTQVSGYAMPEPVGIVVQAGMTSTATITYNTQGPNQSTVGNPNIGTSGVGTLNVLIQPAAISDLTVPETQRAQWRLAGDSRTGWRNSGEDMPGILPGTYLIECKDIPGRATPAPVKVRVLTQQTTTTRILYFTPIEPGAANLQPVSLAEASTRQDLPYAYIGMLRSSTGGSYSGFVVKPQVVATVAQAVFDEANLTMTSDLQWLLQRNQAQFEPIPQTPRGSYIFSSYHDSQNVHHNGYIDQRNVESSPGTLSNESQNLNVAALFFNQPAGRNGFSGFLVPATTTTGTNEFLLSPAMKTLVGYPVAAANAGQMHASPPVNVPFSWTYGQIYTTPDLSPNITGADGMTGGPLCVQYGGGSYYPAAIFVGGTTGRQVRAIDAGVVDLITRAATSGNGGTNDTGGGITRSSFTTIGAPSDPGALKVIIEPAGARTAGAGWRLSPEVSYRTSGAQKNSLSPGFYVLQLRTVTGYQEPTPQSVEIIGGQLREITYTYLENYTQVELWRLANFGTTSNTGNAADNHDPDGDGQPNLFEYAAATDPNNSTSVFKVLTATRAGSTFTATANGKATRTYVLDRRASLAAGSWTSVHTIGPLGADGSVTLTDTSPPANSAFYRIRVTSP